MRKRRVFDFVPSYLKSPDVSTRIALVFSTNKNKKKKERKKEKKHTHTFYLFISLLHRTSQRKAIIKGEGELDVEKSFSVCVNVHVLL